MQIQPQNWKKNDGGGQGNGRGNYRGKRENNHNSGNGGNDGKIWNPGNTNNNSGGGQEQKPRRRHLTTRQTIDTKSIKAFNHDNYFWTHGGNNANDHTSRRCSKQLSSGMHNVNATQQNMMGGKTKGNQMIKPRDVGQPEAPPLQKPQLANSIWNPQAQHQPMHQKPQMGYNMMRMPQMQYLSPQHQQQWKIM